MKPLLILLCAVLLSGCAQLQQIQRDREANHRQALAARFVALNTAPYCSGDVECDRMWQAAQLWVVNNAGYKLQNSTDVVIETFSSPIRSPRLSVRVTKSPTPDGYRIKAVAWCSSVACSPGRDKAVLNFNRAMERVK